MKGYVITRNSKPLLCVVGASGKQAAENRMAWMVSRHWQRYHLSMGDDPTLYLKLFRWRVQVVDLFDNSE